jgi:AraC-like DNA-binding protein
MHSHLTLHFISSCIEILKDGFRPNFCSYPIKFANARLINIPEGQILIQSFSHYLFYFELIEYSLSLKAKINFTVNPAAFFLLMMLEGNTNFHSEFKNLNSQTPSGTFFLAHNEGEYHSVLDPGEHKMFLLTLRPEWLISNSSNLPEFKPLVESHISKAAPIFTLAQCPVDKEVNSILHKMQNADYLKEKNLDTSLHSFVNEILHRYHEMLAYKRYTTKELHQRKATDICSFIKANYRSKIVDDVRNLALQFNVSERVLLRITRTTFGKPLHEQIIEFRLLDALKQLLTSNMQVQEVAELVGYNPNYFTKAFKKYFGIAPSDVSGLCS